MPKAASHALIWSAEQGVYILSERGNGSHPFAQGDDASWLAWLATHSAFSFQGKYGHLNLLRERRARGEAGYWYAYRRQGKRTLKRYVGRSAYLTIAHLEAAAQTLGALSSEAHTAPHMPLQAEEVGGHLPADGSPTHAMNAAAAVPPAPPEERQQPLLTPKLQLPHLHASLVTRERLLTLLDAGLERKLALLAAPAGFGKTTLVRQWIADREAHQRLPPVAWLSLDAGDNDPVRFWRYVITACQTFQADLGRSALALLATPPQPPFKLPPIETVLTAFLNEVVQRASQGILILEDYHVITSPQIHETVTFLLDYLPATLRVIMLTRNDPALPLARLRARNDLCEVHAADLRFSHEETATFLRQAVTAPLPSETMSQIEAHLEGWAAGLRLLALALQGYTSPREIENILATFSGSHRSILEYFVSEVLSAQPEPLQVFLLQTSVLNRLSGSLCDTLTGRSDGGQILEALDRANLFLEPLDDLGEWYRYHALFADAMEHEARRRLGEAALRALSHRASLWLEQHGLLAEAVEMAQRAQDIPRVAELIERFIAALHTYEVNEFHTLRRWLEQLPETVLQQRPVLAFSYTVALLFARDSEQATPMTPRIEELLHMAEDGFRARDDTPKLGEVLAFRSLSARQRGEIAQAMMYAKQSLALLPVEEGIWRGTSLSVLGTGEALVGNLNVARQRLMEARTCSEANGNEAFVRATTNMLSTVYYEQGELHHAAEQYRQVLARARELEDLDDIAHTQLGLTQISYEWNELEAAQQEAQEALDIGEHLVNEMFQIQASLVLARAQLAKGEIAPAQQRLAALLARMQPQGLPLLYREVLILQTSLQLAAGDFSAVQLWVASRSQHDAALPLAYREREELLVARWHLMRGEAQHALGLLIRLLDEARKMRRTRSVLEIQALLALAHAAGKQAYEARQSLHAALSLAHAEGYIRLFLDEGETMAALLRAALPHLREKPLVAYAQALLRAFAHEQTGQAAPPSVAAFSSVEPLSPQEQRVLRLLAAGRSNPEIAGELIVSVNTIRTQVQSIYRKLGVHNRIAASKAARNLQLV